MSDHVQVVTTVPSRHEAERIAQELIDERLAACVQIAGPVRSTYRWEGRLENTEEWQCTAKTRRGLYPQIEAAIRRLHPYEEPEILAFPIECGSPSYLAWVDGEVRRPE